MSSSNSWTSSMMTYLTFLSHLEILGPDIMIRRVSGVVMRMWGGDLDCLALSALEVSPCLTPTLKPHLDDQ